MTEAAARTHKRRGGKAGLHRIGARRRVLRAAGGACTARVPTVEEGQLVTLRELFSAAELTDSCLVTWN
jgi:hypothetical protein